MYEFNKKEIRKKFKGTEYGKKTNGWLYISIIITVIFIIIYGVLCILSCGENIELKITSQILLDILKTLTLISVICMCYFDGKRDGAIEQFKKNIK